MIVDIKTDKLKDCNCGGKMDHYSVAYGSTPYILYCYKCEKSHTMSPYEVTGNEENLIDFWNNHLADMTIEQIKAEMMRYLAVQKRKVDFGEYRYWRWFWYKGRKRVIVKKLKEWM